MLDYPYFKGSYKVIVIDLSKQQTLDARPRAIQKINFTANLEQEIQQCFSLLKKQKKLSQNSHKELQKFCKCVREYNFVEQFNFYQYRMAHYNSLNVKLSNSQLNKLKCTIKQ